MAILRDKVEVLLMALITLNNANVYIQRLQQMARLDYPTLDTSPTAIENDYTFNVAAYAGELFINTLQAVINRTNTVNLTGTDLDNEGAIYGTERDGGKYANGYETFYTTITPGTGGTLIPDQSQVMTRAGLQGFSYYTQGDVYIYATDWVADNNRYEVTVPIKAADVGSNYNIGPGLIDTIIGTISGVEGCINYSIVDGGTDEEGDPEFMTDVLNIKKGRNIGSNIGISTRVKKQFLLDDTTIIMPYDTYSERSLGSDVFCTEPGTIPMSGDTYTYNSALYANQIIPLMNPLAGQNMVYPQPVELLISCTVNGTNLPVYNIAPSPDPGTPYALLIKYGFPPYTYGSQSLENSIDAQDAVQIKNQILTNGDTIVVGYNYYDLESLQAYLSDRNNLIPAVPFLAKVGHLYALTINASVAFKTGVNILTEQANINSALALYLGTFTLGMEVAQSNLETVIQEGYSTVPISSVNYVIINSFSATDRYGNTINPVSEVLAMDLKYYLRFGSIIFS